MAFGLLHVILDRIGEILLKNYSRQIIFYLMPINEKIFNKRLINMSVGPYALYIHINMNYTDQIPWHKQKEKFIERMIHKRMVTFEKNP